MATEFSLFYCTCPDSATAEKISLALLQERLIACANILPGMQSLYWWQGKIETSQEVVLILKSQASRKTELEQRFSDLHPYEVPCLVELPIASGLTDYLNWMRKAAQPN